MKFLNKKITILIPIILILLISFHINSWVGKFTDTASKEQIQKNLPLYLIGGIRNTIANLLWLKIDLYHHSWEWSGKHWANNQNLMMLYRIVTYLNPKFDKAYAQGGFHLSTNLKKKEEGIKFLKEGLKNNPNSYEINFELGYEYFFGFADYKNALEHFRKAVLLTEDEHKLQVCYKLLAHSYFKLGDYNESLNYWFKVKKLAPKQPMIDHWIEEIKTKMDEEIH